MTTTQWATVQLGSLAHIRRGSSPRPISSSRWFDPWSDIGWVRIGDIANSNGRVLADTSQRLSPAGIARSRQVATGTLIMSIAATVGRPIVTGFETCIHDGFVSFERLHDVDRDFLFYVLQAMEPQWSAAGQTGSQSNVNTGIVARTEVRIPLDLKEQRRIAVALGEADDLIDSLERVITKKQAIKQGMQQQLLKGKTRLPGFTESWPKGGFDQLARPSRERSMPRDVPSTTPLIELEQLEGGTGRLLFISSAAEAGSLKAVFRPEDVLFGKLRAYLRKYWYANVAGLCTTEIWVLRARAGSHGRFVRYVVETEEFIDVASGAYGTHMPRSDWGTVRNLPVGIPPHDEQVAIASVLGDTDDEIDLLYRRLEKARGVKQGMSQELISGRTRLPMEVSAA